jgi:hypothetical protein
LYTNIDPSYEVWVRAVIDERIIVEQEAKEASKRTGG